ncbi:RNA polymerase II transcriptional coactivator KELP isoform X2 [Cornus florida]|uniref:RNA polymerase II transcriptional coactivator KELP isoform X2 n=1 Tax=Cornus florida TaxID=4283 RepID=UPI00289EA80A|nr:RNA polymerase II transcriptional coactivator KELP isoform X2 [Cornus florida]
MEPETQEKIEETVLEILRSSNMDETTESKIRKMASDRLGIDLSQPDRKQFVRKVVNAYLEEEKAKAETEPAEEITITEQPEEEGDEEEGRKRKRGGAKEFDDEGDLIVCKLSERRRVTIQDFRGKTLVSIREYYRRDGKELPTSKVKYNRKEDKKYQKRNRDPCETLLAIELE